MRMLGKSSTKWGGCCSHKRSGALTTMSPSAYTRARQKMTAGRGWAFIAAFTIAWELLCDPDHLLSRGMDRARANPLLRVLIDAFLVVTLLHLTRNINPRWDVYNRIPQMRTENQ